MNTTQLKSRRGEKGFTLVELAIVMIIIGLLITGVLKGQEMIANAQVSSTIVQIKSMDAAASTFRDIYNAFPGDMRNASTRLRDCNVAFCQNGNGDGRIGIGIGAPTTVANESIWFFTQMAAADLISGVDNIEAAFGSALPAASVGGGYKVGHTGAGVAAAFTAGEFRPGHYLNLTGTLAGASDGSGVLLVSQAARIDRKLDDGLPGSGSVIGESTGLCRTGGIEYGEANVTQLCNIAIRIQG